MRPLPLLAFTFVSAACLQAQIDQLGSPDLGNLTASAILGWYAWHTTTKAIPSLVGDFRQELATIRGEQRGERDLFRTALAEERQARRDDHRAIAAALEGLVERLPAAVSSERSHAAGRQ